MSVPWQPTYTIRVGTGNDDWKARRCWKNCIAGVYGATARVTRPFDGPSPGGKVSITKLLSRPIKGSARVERPPEQHPVFGVVGGGGDKELGRALQVEMSSGSCRSYRWMFCVWETWSEHSPRTGEAGSVPSGVARFFALGNVADTASCRRVSSGLSPFRRPIIPPLLHLLHISTPLALKPSVMYLNYTGKHRLQVNHEIEGENRYDLWSKAAACDAAETTGKQTGCSVWETRNNQQSRHGGNKDPYIRHRVAGANDPRVCKRSRDGALKEMASLPVKCLPASSPGNQGCSKCDRQRCRTVMNTSRTLVSSSSANLFVYHRSLSSASWLRSTAARGELFARYAELCSVLRLIVWFTHRPLKRSSAFDVTVSVSHRSLVSGRSRFSSSGSTLVTERSNTPAVVLVPSIRTEGEITSPLQPGAHSNKTRRGSVVLTPGASTAGVEIRCSSISLLTRYSPPLHILHPSVRVGLRGVHWDISIPAVPPPQRSGNTASLRRQPTRAPYQHGHLRTLVYATPMDDVGILRNQHCSGLRNNRESSRVSSTHSGVHATTDLGTKAAAILLISTESKISYLNPGRRAEIAVTRTSAADINISAQNSKPTSVVLEEVVEPPLRRRNGSCVICSSFSPAQSQPPGLLGTPPTNNIPINMDKALTNKLITVNDEHW
ncbi:hypothetical protein PR048_023584 [Dryococelus australis]|uniref:Uncharacterized protein n=1 Tax=Dryococelus australis TaxID=614101 RepID=A0ABQ9GUH4_9NEOP|nr:hypothetical protein PR048_023584 [Dryococelus australis]